MHINLDHFLETSEGRIITPERNTWAWEYCFKVFQQALQNSDSSTTVYLMIGCQGSGKSTWAREKLVHEPSTVIFDAILVKYSERRPLLAAAVSAGVPVIAVWMKTSLQTCIERNAARPLSEYASEQGLRNVFAAIEAPTTAEGFQAVIEVLT